MTKRILVIGSSNIDLVAKTSSIPSSGETIISKGSYSYVPGGKGANAAVAVSRLGGDVYFCTHVGTDSYGKKLMQIFYENNINTDYCREDSTEQTGLAIVLVEPDGSNRIIVYSGANKNLTRNDIDRSFLCSPDAVYLNLEIPNEAVKYIIALANTKKIPVFLDCGGIHANFTLNSIGKIEVVSPNENETYILTGIHPNSLDNCMKAAMKIYSMTDIKYVIIKRGEKGCYIYDGIYCRISGPYKVNAVDTTAAGDAFTSAMTLKYTENGGNIYDACKYANAVGALTVTKPGAVYSLPKKSEVEEFIKNNDQI